MKKKNSHRKITFLNIVMGLQKDLIVGGQAVMEGVMMRTPSAYAIAVRKKDGSIVHTAESLPKWSDKHKWLRHSGSARRCDFGSVNGVGNQGTELFGERRARRYGS